MKLNFLLITILTIAMFSCQTSENKESQYQPSAEQVFEEIKNLPDTVLTSKKIKQNEFQANLSEILIDNKQTSKLNGEWTAQNGEIDFLNSSFESGDRILFYDTVRTSVTGWGTIRYNRAAKFYFTESGSHMYEFYVVEPNKLVLTHYDYRNEDLTMKEIPEPNIQELDIEFMNDNQVKISLKEQTVELKRK